MKKNIKCGKKPPKKKPVLFLPKWLPQLASGKSTWARAKVKSSRNVCIVSRDSFREMLVSDYSDFPFGQSKLEKLITEAVILMVSKLISYGYSVILDETNLNQGRLNETITKIKSSIPDNKFSTEVIDFTQIDLGECIKRDKNRIRSAGENVIQGMYKKYLSHE